MKRLFFLLSAFALAFMFVACDSGNTGDFKISLRLPVDSEGVCGDFENEDEDEETANDYTYCINKTDQVSLVIYSKQKVTDDYVYTDRKLIEVNDNDGGKEEFIRTLKKGTYYRFFVEVTNSNEKLKLTGGIDGVLYDDGENFDVDIFLAPAGDFARVVANRKNGKNEYDSMKSYFDDKGSKGAAAVALKDGSIYMAGGYDMEEGELTKKAVVFNMKSLSADSAKDLDIPLQDHVAALLDDGSETGKVVVGLGKSEEGLNDTLWLYDPEDNKYSKITDEIGGVTKAKAITVNGDVYIIGGCTETGASAGVYKISAETKKAEHFATLNKGRCNHAVAYFPSITTKEDAEGNTETTVVPRILVIGGSVDNKTEGEETPVVGKDFVEIISLESKTSTSVEVVDRKGGDDAKLAKEDADNMPTGLIAPAAVGVIMDDNDSNEAVVSVLGGYLRNDENGETAWVANPRLLVFSESGDKLVYDANSTPNECARPSAALLGAEEKSVLKYVAVNCGTSELEREVRNISEQIIFVLQVKRVKDSDLNMEVFSSSVKTTLMEENHDGESDAMFVDGPVAVDAMGQVFMLGGKYVYQVGSYAIP